MDDAGKPADTLRHWFENAIVEEQKQIRPDTRFVADCYEEMAGLYRLSDPLRAYVFHWESLQKHNLNASGADAATDALRQLNEMERIARECVQNSVVFNPFQPDLQTQVELGQYCPIREVRKLNGDSFLITIQAGTFNGMELGFNGGILSSDHKLIRNRGNKVLGSFTVTGIDLYQSRAIAVRKAGMELDILPGDNAYLIQKITSATYRGLLFDLSRLNVNFSRNDLQSFYQPMQLQYLRNAADEEQFLRVMMEDIHTTAGKRIELAKADEIEPPAAAGRFGGMNLYEAMLQSDLADLRAYLRFVRAFPARYMGRHYRLDETYATWIINKTPNADRSGQSGSSEAESLFADFCAQSRANWQPWILSNQYYIEKGRNFRSVFSRAIQTEQLAGRLDSALYLCEGLLHIGRSLASDTLLSSAIAEYGLIHLKAGNYDSAIRYFSEVISLGIDTVKAYWWRGHAFERQASVGKAIEDFGVLIRAAPKFAGGHGAYGWTLIESGKFKQAMSYCKTAFELDSSEIAWRINYGHCFLLAGNRDSAELLYRSALNEITETGTFKTHFEADFHLFLENGWEETAVKELRTQLRTQWYGDDYHRVQCDSLFKKGAGSMNAGDYRLAGRLFDQALKAEMHRPNPRRNTLRHIYRMRGVCAFQLNERELMRDQYEKALVLSRDSMRDPALQLEDLDDLSFIYKLMGDPIRSDMALDYRKHVSRSLDELTAGNNLYLICVGRNSYQFPGYRYAESDARSIFDHIRAKAPLHFNSVHGKLLSGDSVGRANLRDALNDVIRESQYGDCFIFYFAGYAQDGFLDLDGDSIEAWEMRHWLASMRARKQLVILDAPGKDFYREFSGHGLKEELPDDPGDLHLICPDGTRQELAIDRGGWLSTRMIEIFNGENIGAEEKESGLLSVKGLEHRLYQQDQKNLNTTLLTMSRGGNFPVIPLPAIRIDLDTIAPGILLTSAIVTGIRGGKVRLHRSGNELEGRVYDNVGVRSLKLNGRPLHFQENGRFVIEKGQLNETSITLTATDHSGNRSSRYFDLNDMQTEASNTAPSQIRQGKNYALLFATNRYDEWNDLSNPISDVEEIGRILRESYGFQVRIIRNATRTELLDSLYSYLNRNYGPKDQLFIFFAGHGLNDPNLAGQLVCSDSRLNDHRTLPSYIPFSFITDNFDRNNCQHIFLAMDVCFGGAYFDHRSAPRYLDAEVERIGKDVFIERKSIYKSRQFLTSGGNEYVPDGKPGSHSPFATKFIETLESGKNKGYLTLIDFVDHMRMISTQPRYGSFGSHHPDGEFVFTYSAKEGVKPQASTELGVD